MADQDNDHEDLLPLCEGEEEDENLEENEEEQEGLFVEDSINDVLAKCGATVDQQKAMQLEGFSTMEDFLVFSTNRH
jgi:hypothetical protein